MAVSVTGPTAKLGSSVMPGRAVVVLASISSDAPAFKQRWIGVFRVKFRIEKY